MTKLSVNINKIATLRNARGTNVPDLVKTARDIERFGAQGITIHPRPDERHIKMQDAYELKKNIITELNIEGYPSEDFLLMIESLKPTQTTFVPDHAHVLTSNAGWDTVTHFSFLRDTIARIKKAGVRTSLFIAPDQKFIEHAALTGTDRIELYTEAYARNYTADKLKAITPYINAAKKAHELNIGINAGHDLNLQNLQYFKNNISNLLEVSIGHALICDALYYGLENVVQMYLRLLK